MLCAFLIASRSSLLSRQALFIVPTFAGTTACYNECLKYIGETTCDVVGITDPHLCGNKDFMFAGGDGAQIYLDWMNCFCDAIQSKQPEGPYRVMGYSQGAAWAYSVGVILKERGAKVEAVIMLDAIFNPWERAKKALDYFSYFMNAQVMWFLPRFLVRILLDGMRSNFGLLADTSSKNARKKAFPKMVADTFAKPTEALKFACFAEMDTGVKVADNLEQFKAFKSKGYESPVAMYAALMAEKFPGVDAKYVEDVIFVSSVSVARGKEHVAPTCPVDVPVYCIQAYRPPKGKSMADKSGMLKLAPHLKEIVVDLGPTPSKPHPAAKLPDDIKPMETHFRCMHSTVYFDAIKKVMTEVGGIL